MPSGVHELEEEVEEGAVNEVDDEIPHPVTKCIVHNSATFRISYRTLCTFQVKLHNWASHLRPGQISGVAINPNDEPVIFHRGNVEWGPE